MQGILSSLPEEFRDLARPLLEKLHPAIKQCQRGPLGEWRCKMCTAPDEPGKRLQACAKCKAIGRKVMYCSR